MSRSGVKLDTRKASAVDAFGHSYLTTGASENSRLFHNAFGRMVGVGAVVNNGIGGSLLIRGNGTAQGGAGALLQVLSPSVVRNFGMKAYPPTMGPVLTAWGLNDFTDAITNNGVDLAAVLAAWRAAVRASIAHVQASLLLQSEDATITVLGGAGWATFGSVGINSGAGYSQSATAGVTVTITLPATFVGGYVDLGFVTNRVGGATPASAIGFTIDGQAVNPIGYPAGFSTVDVNPTVIATSGTAVARFLLTPGAHTIVATAGAGGMAYDRLTFEATPPRPILWGNIARTPNCTATQLAAIAQANAATAAVLAEFPPGIVSLVDTDAALGNNPNNFSDGTHPNDLGHLLLAGSYADAWTAFPLSAAGRAAI